MIRVLPNRNGREFQTFYIRARSGTYSAQWDWGITYGVLIPTYSQLKRKWFDLSTKKNGQEFQNFYIRPHLAVDSAKWDWGMSD